MFSKLISFLLVISFVLASCSNKNKPLVTNQDSPLSEINICTTGAKTIIKSYLNKTLLDTDLEKFWNCTHSLLDKLVKYTESEKPYVYNVKEARALIKYLFNKKDVSIRLTKAILSIKQLIAGGTKSSLTHEDIRRLKLFIDAIKLESFYLKPYIKDIYARLKNDGTTTYSSSSKELNIVLFNSLDRIKNTFTKHNVDLKIKDLKQLLAGLSKTFKLKSSLKPWGDLFYQLKALLVSPNKDTILSSEWPQLFTIFHKSMSILITYSERTDPEEDLTSSKNLLILDEIVKTTSELLSNGLSQRASKSYKNEEIFVFIDTLEELSILKEGGLIAPSSAKEFWKLITNKLLTKKSNIFHTDDVQYIVSEFKAWASLQKEINNNEFSQRYSCQISSISNRALKKPQKSESKEFSKEKLPKLEDNPRNELTQIAYCSSWSLNIENSLLIMDQKNYIKPVNNESLTQMNLLRALIKPIINQYGEEEKTLENRFKGLTEKQFQTFLMDINPFLKSLGVLLEKDFYKTILLQINLFMPQSNGNKEIDFIEAIQYIQYAFSGATSAQLFTKASQACVLQESSELLDRDCAIRFLITKRLAYVPNFLDFNLFLSKNKTEGSQFIRDAVEAVTKKLSGPVAIRDLPKIMILFSFVETYMMKFDTNRNGLIEYSEAKESYTSLYKKLVLELFLKEVTGLYDSSLIKPEQVVESSFVFLLLKGALPGLKDRDSILMSQLSFWIFKPDHYNLKGSRKTLISAILSTAAASENKN